jgi:DNA-binding NarL/FixJ family response regulator
MIKDANPIRVILTDDHSLVRQGMRVLLEQLPEVCLVGEASNGKEALQLIRQERPDVVLADLAMPGLNGLALILAISKSVPEVRMIVLSAQDDEFHVSGALRAGATGYLLKQNADLAELRLAIQCVALGVIYLTPAISRRVVESYLRSVPESLPRDPLTPRQNEVLRLIVEGLNTKEIAHQLDISAKTVDTHRAELMGRLRIHDVAGLVRYAIQERILSLD